MLTAGGCPEVPDAGAPLPPAVRIAEDGGIAGRAYETFAAMELSRLLPYTDTAPAVRHWRDHHGHEVDIVLEDRRGRVIGIEALWT